MAMRGNPFTAENCVLAVMGLALVAACVYVGVRAHNWRADYAASAPVLVSSAPPPLPPPSLDVAVDNQGFGGSNAPEGPALADLDPVAQDPQSGPNNAPAPRAPEPKSPAIPHPPSVSIAAPPLPPARPADLHPGSAPFTAVPGSEPFTAVYDLTAHKVYLPNGAALEAHSGLGDRLDDPRYVEEPDRGATPPHVYDLSLREQPFHGVQALRLSPVGGAREIFGRAGLLAHTYMLGPNGDSNGCVSFKDYDTFLQAFQTGQVKRLVVVAGLK